MANTPGMNEFLKGVSSPLANYGNSMRPGTGVLGGTGTEGGDWGSMWRVAGTQPIWSGGGGSSNGAVSNWTNADTSSGWGSGGFNGWTPGITQPGSTAPAPAPTPSYSPYGWQVSDPSSTGGGSTPTPTPKTSQSYSPETPYFHGFGVSGFWGSEKQDYSHGITAKDGGLVPRRRSRSYADGGVVGPTVRRPGLEYQAGIGSIGEFRPLEQQAGINDVGWFPQDVGRYSDDFNERQAQKDREFDLKAQASKELDSFRGDEFNEFQEHRPPAGTMDPWLTRNVDTWRHFKNMADLSGKINQENWQKGLEAEPESTNIWDLRDDPEFVDDPRTHGRYFVNEQGLTEKERIYAPGYKRGGLVRDSRRTKRMKKTRSTAEAMVPRHRQRSYANGGVVGPIEGAFRDAINSRSWASSPSDFAPSMSASASDMPATTSDTSAPATREWYLANRADADRVDRQARYGHTVGGLVHFFTPKYGTYADGGMVGPMEQTIRNAIDSRSWASSPSTPAPMPASAPASNNGVYARPGWDPTNAKANRIRRGQVFRATGGIDYGGMYSQYGSFNDGGLVQGYDDGGLISGYADGPVAQDTYGGDDYTVDPLDMVHEALSYGRKKMGLPSNFETGEYDQPSYDEGGEVQEEGVINQRPPPDPRQTLGYLMGQGSLAPDIAQSLEQQADPDGAMSPSERTMAAMQVAPTPDAKFGYLQSKRVQYNGLSAAARAALDHGQPAQAASYANQAFAQVPDGMDTQVMPAGNGFVMRQRPLRTGGPSPRRSQVKSFQGGGPTGDGEEFIPTEQLEELLVTPYDRMLDRATQREEQLIPQREEQLIPQREEQHIPQREEQGVTQQRAEPVTSQEWPRWPGYFDVGTARSIERRPPAPPERPPGPTLEDMGRGVVERMMRAVGPGSTLPFDRGPSQIETLPPPAEAPKPPDKIEPPELPKPAEPEPGTKIIRGATPGVGKPTNFMVYVDKGRGWMYGQGADGKYELVPGQGGDMEGQTLDLVKGVVKRDRSLGRTGRIVSEGEPPPESEGGPPRQLSGMVPNNDGTPSNLSIPLAQRGLTMTSDGTVVRAPVTAADRAAAARPPAAAAPAAAAPAAPGAGAPRTATTAAPAAARQPHPHWDVDEHGIGSLSSAGIDYIEKKVDDMLDRMGYADREVHAVMRDRLKWGGADPQHPGQDATTRARSWSRGRSTGAVTAPRGEKGVGGGTESPSSSSTDSGSESSTIPGDRRSGAAMGEPARPGMMTLALEQYTRSMQDKYKAENAERLVTAAGERRDRAAEVKAADQAVRTAETRGDALVSANKAETDSEKLRALIVPKLEAEAALHKLSPQQTTIFMRRHVPDWLPNGRRVGQRSFYDGNWYVLGTDGIPRLE